MQPSSQGLEHVDTALQGFQNMTGLKTLLRRRKACQGQYGHLSEQWRLYLPLLSSWVMTPNTSSASFLSPSENDTIYTSFPKSGEKASELVEAPSDGETLCNYHVIPFSEPCTYKAPWKAAELVQILIGAIVVFLHRLVIHATPCYMTKSLCVPTLG